MPWRIVSESADCPASKPFAVVQKSDGKKVGCHPTLESAKKQLAALYANEPQASAEEATMESETRKTFTADQRKALAAKGHAMPDGSFPIENTADLKNAIGLVGNAKDPAAARRHIKKRAKALGAESMIPASWEQQQENSARPPRDEVIRALATDLAGLELREEPDGVGTLTGHFAVFDQWTHIKSAFEGEFMERISPGAFTKAFQDRAGMRVLFNHGKDGLVGDKPLGPIQELREDDTGAYYEVPLLDTAYNRELVPGLKAGLYGSSFRFRVMRESMKKNVQKSDMNPNGLPERTVQEVGVREFGPVVFPAYAGATATIRSMTDEFFVARLAADPDRLREIVSYFPVEPESGDLQEESESDTLDLDAPREARRGTQSAPVSGRRVSSTGHQPYVYGTQKRGKPTWLL